MSGQPALGVQRCLGVKKAVKLEKSLGAHQKGINSNQSRGGGWGAVSCLFVCLLACLFSGFFLSKRCAGSQKERRVENHSVLRGEVWLLACCGGSAVCATVADVSSWGD